MSNNQKDSKNKNQWNSNFSFLMAMIGAAIGLGNIWRFSYVLYSNGGGSFLIPYFFAITVMGIPFLILEYGVGFKFKDSFSNILKKIKPKFEIIGWFTIFLVFLVLTYYVVIMGWDLIYFILSFFKGWGLNPNTFFNTNIVVGGNNLNNLFRLVLPTFISVIFVWTIIWLISHKTLESGISRVTKVLLPLLFIMMAFIVVYSFTLNGHEIGLNALFSPDWGALAKIDIWLAAFAQIIFSLSMGQGIAVTYASYLPKNSKLTDNVFLVVASNSGFELFTALGVFSIIGFMSFTTGVPVNDIATSGTGLLFIVFPEIFNIMGDIAYIIAPIFFLCVFFAGITSALAFLEPMSLAVNKKFGTGRKRATTLLCIFGFLISVVYTTGSGNYILTLADAFLNQFGILLAVVLQAIIFGWIYGIDKVVEILNNQSKIRVGKLWITVIKYILPLIIIVMWITGIITLIQEENSTSLLIQLIISLIFVLIPLILTKLPSKKNYFDKE